MEVLIILAVLAYMVGYALVFNWCENHKVSNRIGNLIIAFASWLLVLLYAIHYLYNKK